jgi:hypothetical protein
LAERKARVSDNPSPDYDLLFWDAPATGHFLSTLRAAKSFEAYLTGPFALAGAEVARFFSNAAYIQVVPVTTLEEMAIDETVELCAALDRDFRLQPAAVILNLVSPLAGATAAEVGSVAGTPQDPALQFALERGRLERERAAGLRTRIQAPALPVERVRRWSNDLDLLRQAGRWLEALQVA